MELFRMRFNDGSFQHAGYIGHTKDKNLAVLSLGLLEKNKAMYDASEYIVESVNVDLKACNYKMNAFSDTQDAHVIAETNSYIYVVKESLGNIAWSSIEKMKKADIGTIGLRTSGISLK